MPANAPSLRLPVFEGPLELLLHLIEKNKIDIYDIPIFEITKQYLEYLKNWDDLNMEVASEFIVMAATLINIKARKLLPLAEQDGDGEDEEALLIARLLEYKRYKDGGRILGTYLPSPRKLIGHGEGIVRVGVQRELAHEVDNAYGTERRIVRGIAPARTLGSKVGRTQDTGVIVQIRLQLPSCPGMISQRDHVRAGGKNSIRLLRRREPAAPLAVQSPRTERKLVGELQPLSRRHHVPTPHIFMSRSRLPRFSLTSASSRNVSGSRSTDSLTAENATPPAFSRNWMSCWSCSS